MANDIIATPAPGAAPVEPVTPAADPAAAAAPATPEPAAPIQTEQEKAAASRFAALSRKEKAIRHQEKQLADLQKKLDTDRAAMESEFKSKYIDPVEFKKNPYKYIKDHGLTLEQIAEIALNDGRPTAESIVSETEKRLMSKIEEMEKKLAEKEAKETEDNYEQVLQGFMSKLTKEVNDNPDYELIRANDAVEVVYQVIDAAFNEKLNAYIEENGEEPDAETRQSFIMSNKDACDKVESYLLEEAKKHLALNKIKGLIPAPAIPKEPSKAQPTLTNTDATTVPTRGERMLTDEESKREAAKLLKWEQ